MDQTTKDLLKQIADIEKTPQGAYNFRVNGQGVERNCTEEINIVSKQDKSGIDIIIKPNTKQKSVHIPVIVSQSGLDDLVYNDFYVGDNCDVVIVAGCGIHNNGDKKSSHNGVHSFHIGKNSKVKYIEKHLAIGNSKAEKVLNPITKVYMKKNSYMEMETTQLGGVSYSNRKTKAVLRENAKLVIREKILTTESQEAKTNFNVVLKGQKSSVDVISRSVARDFSKQTFNSSVDGKNECFGHIECDGIITDKAIITSTPKIIAENVESTLVHEAAIGKIAGEQLLKLMTLGLSQEEAEKEIIKNFMN